MNTEGLEWFGPPKRNTLRPRCVVLFVLSEVENGIIRSESELVLCLPSSRLAFESLGESRVCSEHLPFISQGRHVHGR